MLLFVIVAFYLSTFVYGLVVVVVVVLVVVVVVGGAVVVVVVVLVVVVVVVVVVVGYVDVPVKVPQSVIRTILPTIVQLAMQPAPSDDVVKCAKLAKSWLLHTHTSITGSLADTVTVVILRVLHGSYVKLACVTPVYVTLYVLQLHGGITTVAVTRAGLLFRVLLYTAFLTATAL